MRILCVKSLVLSGSKEYTFRRMVVYKMPDYYAKRLIAEGYAVEFGDSSELSKVYEAPKFHGNQHIRSEDKLSPDQNVLEKTAKACGQEFLNGGVKLICGQLLCNGTKAYCNSCKGALK